MRYHLYMILQGCDFKDAEVDTYGATFGKKDGGADCDFKWSE